MNKNYYEFVFMNDLGKNLSVKIPNAKAYYDIDQFAEDMDFIITSNIILTSSGAKPIAKKYVKYIKPQVIDVTIN